MSSIQNAINQILALITTISANIAAIISGASPATTQRTNPEWANQLDELNLNAITTAVPGTGIDTLAYDKVTVCVVATAIVGAGGTFTFQASPDGTNWGTVASTGSNDTSAETQAITADGTYLFEIDIKKLKQFRTNLTARTDGTYSVYVWG